MGAPAVRRCSVQHGLLAPSGPAAMQQDATAAKPKAGRWISEGSQGVVGRHIGDSQRPQALAAARAGDCGAGTKTFGVRACIIAPWLGTSADACWARRLRWKAGHLAVCDALRTTCESTPLHLAGPAAAHKKKVG